MYNIIQQISINDVIDKKAVKDLLSLEKEEDKNKLFLYADKVRKANVGDHIFLRGIIEFSNECMNTCSYCGINKQNTKLRRYLLTIDQIIKSVKNIIKDNIKTVVLQSGQNDLLDYKWMSELIKEIKNSFDIALTLSIGEKPYKHYKAFKDAGADRFLLKIETTDKHLYKKFHPQMDIDNRIRCLNDLKLLEYQTGSGIIVGLQGQTIESIVKDLIFLKDMDFYMISISPLITDALTDKSQNFLKDNDLVFKVLAVARIFMSKAHFPAVTALKLKGHKDAFKALGCGSNVLMFNYTPEKVRRLYSIYPGKGDVLDDFSQVREKVEEDLKIIKRRVSYSKGDSFKINLKGDKYA